MTFRHVIAALASMALAACTSMQPLNTTPAELREIVKPGDHLIVYEKSGRINDMTLVAMSDDRVHGVGVEDRQAVSISFSDIERIEIERVDGSRTVLAVLGASAVAAVLIAAIAAAGAVAILGAAP